MKKLIIVRHAKSSWEYDVIDHERPLKSRGVSDAHLISGIIQEENFQIDKVISSDALRAKSTAEIFIENLGFNPHLVGYIHKLYDFEGGNLLKVIKECDDTVSCLMVFGHNHAITNFVNTYGSQKIFNVPTSGVVVIEFDILSWKDINLGKTLKTFFPKSFKIQ